jgi:hypothetical protein
MEQKVLSITEAFSQQPCAYYVCRLCDNPNNKHQHTDDCVKEIYLEKTEFYVNGEAKIFHVYIGINMKGKIVFKWLATSVNVNYYYPEVL